MIIYKIIKSIISFNSFLSNYEKSCFGNAKCEILVNFLKDFNKESFQKIIYSMKDEFKNQNDNNKLQLDSYLQRDESYKNQI